MELKPMLVSLFIEMMPDEFTVSLERMRADRLPFLRSPASVPTMASLNVQTTPLFVITPVV